MNPADDLLSEGGTVQIKNYDGKMITLHPQVFKKTNSVYAVYLPAGEAGGILNLLETDGSFSLQWYNPRTGKFEGKIRRINGGGKLPLGTPSKEAKSDWAVHIKKQ